MLREQLWEFMPHETVVRPLVTRADFIEAIKGLSLTLQPYESSSMSAASDGLMTCSVRSPTWAQWRQPLHFRPPARPLQAGSGTVRTAGLGHLFAVQCAQRAELTFAQNACRSWLTAHTRDPGVLARCGCRSTPEAGARFMLHAGFCRKIPFYAVRGQERQSLSSVAGRHAQKASPATP